MTRTKAEKNKAAWYGENTDSHRCGKCDVGANCPEVAEQAAPGLPLVQHPHRHHPQASLARKNLRRTKTGGTLSGGELPGQGTDEQWLRADGYARDMELEHIYAEAEKR
mgnify:FL=1